MFPVHVVSLDIVEGLAEIIGVNNIDISNATTMLVDTAYCRIVCPSLRLHIKQMVGPPRFELGSDGPQPPSIGQANPRAPECILRFFPVCTEWSHFMNQFNMTQVHSSAAVSVQANFIQCLADLDTC